jgi:hypothetical protein
VGAKKAFINFGTDWWIWMKSCMKDEIEDDLDSILFNSAASNVPKGRTFKLLRWVKLLNRWVNLYEILYGCDDIEYCFL